MVGLAAAQRLATGLPEVAVGSSRGNRTWSVGGKAFAWVRPFSKADVRRFGDAVVPAGPILALRVADLRTKETVLAERIHGVFTIPHFDGYPAVLVQLDVVAERQLQRLVTDAWLACVPPSLAASRAPVRRQRR